MTVSVRVLNLFDTWGFFVQITEDEYEFLIQKGLMTQRIDRETGFVEFEYTNFRTAHSWNYRVQWKVDNMHMMKVPGFATPQECKGIPYLRFEFSVPKLLFGHNCESVGIDGVVEACAIVKAGFEVMSGMILSGPGDWYVYRVDVCANFILHDINEVKSFIRYLQRMDYPRRVGNAYKDTGMYFASVHNTLKLYCKGAEFKKHDAERFISELDRMRLQKQADNILRVEVELKRRIKYIVEKYEVEWNEKLSKFKGCICFDDLLTVIDFNEELVRVMKTFLVSKTTKAMRSLEVLDVLKSVLGARAARMNYAIYMLLVTQGQAEVKRQIPKPSYYRALKIFRENDISVVASDVNKSNDFKENTEFEYILGMGFPADFSLEMSNANKYYQMPKAA